MDAFEAFEAMMAADPDVETMLVRVSAETFLAQLRAELKLAIDTPCDCPDCRRTDRDPADHVFELCRYTVSGLRRRSPEALAWLATAALAEMYRRDRAS